MVRCAQETTIKASPEAVFAYVSDMSRHGEWGGHELHVMQTSSGPAGVGSTFASTAKLLGTQREKQTVTAYEPGRKFAFQATGSLGLAQHEFNLAAADGDTRVEKSMELIEPSFLGRLASVRIKAVQAKELAQDLSRIKAKLEGQ